MPRKYVSKLPGADITSSETQSCNAMLSGPVNTHLRQDLNSASETSCEVKSTLLVELTNILDGIIVVGKVTAKLPMKEVLINSEIIRLFVFDLDDGTAHITCTAYGETGTFMADKYKVDDVIQIQRFILHPRQQVYFASMLPYEVHITSMNNVRLLNTNSMTHQSSLRYYTFADIHMMDTKSIINTIGVIQKINRPVEKCTRNGTTQMLTTIILRDEHHTLMMLSVWNMRSYTFPFQVMDDIYIKNCKVQEHEGIKSLMATTTTQFTYYESPSQQGINWYNSH